MFHLGGMPNATKNEIIALERNYWDAVKRKDGKRTSNLSGKLSLNAGARGVTSISKEKMGQMTEAGEYSLDAFEFSDVEVVTPDPDFAIIAYTVQQSGKISA